MLTNEFSSFLAAKRRQKQDELIRLQLQVAALQAAILADSTQQNTRGASMDLDAHPVSLPSDSFSFSHAATFKTSDLKSKLEDFKSVLIVEFRCNDFFADSF